MIKIYGASDDLIEIDGAISDEIGCYNATNKTITCADGTKAKITYDGEWKITVKEKGPKFMKIITGNPAEDPHTDPDAKGCPPYSDVLIMMDTLAWVKIGGKTFKPF